MNIEIKEARKAELEELRTKRNELISKSVRDHDPDIIKQISSIDKKMQFLGRMIRD